MSARALLATFSLLLTACAARHPDLGVYRLLNAGPARILVPPGISDPAIAVRTLDFPLAGPVPSTCRTRDEVVRVEPHREFLRITVHRDPLLAHPAPWLPDRTAALEQQGCIPPGKSAALAEQIVESVPMNPSDAYGLLHPAAATFGYVDLAPGYRLKLVSPILREGAPAGASALATNSVSGNDAKLSVTVKSSSDFLGYEISWYTVESGSKMTFSTAESHIGNQVTTSRRPRVNHFAFPETAACYRLFYLTRVSQADHDIAVLSAPTCAELNRQTPAFASDPDACAKAPPHTCVALPKEIGVTTYLTATANGAPLDVPAGSTIADVLRTAGVKQPTTVLPSLTVRRDYKGTLTAVEFDRAKPDILTLHVMGHEDIRW